MSGGRWEFFSDDELMAIENAAWVQDQEYGMDEALRAMLPDIIGHLEDRGWEMRECSWRRKAEA